MTALPFPCPEPPHWRVDWDVIDREYDWIRDMRDCPQDAVHHAEGNVWIHVRKVCEAMAGLEGWRILPPLEREILFAAALLHDVAKPACTRHEDGRITSRGHSLRGSKMTRRILWEMDVAFPIREQVCALVRHHQSPFHLIERDDPRRLAYLISQTARCDLLARLATCDALGRECADRSSILDRVELFEEYCREQECLHGPRKFPSDHSRFLYFRTEDRDANYLAYDDTRCQMTLMSGLPGAGKDTWIARTGGTTPVVSLDAIRAEIGVAPSEDQGPVTALARERVRAFLRAGRDFIWNATNLSREIRKQSIDLAAAYGARVRIVYVESPAEALWRQNANRERPVREDVIVDMLRRWEVPELTEAHSVEYHVG